MQWQVETIIKLLGKSAKVTILDLADYARFYSVRIFIKNVLMPVYFRIFLRKFLVNKKTFVNNIFYNFILENKITHYKLQIGMRSILPSFRLSRLGKLVQNSSKFEQDLILTVVSNLLKKQAENSDFINVGLVKDLQYCIRNLKSEITKIDFAKYDNYFLFNGRQPSSSIAIEELVKQNQLSSIILFEGSGGFMFPNLSRPRLDYFFTTPHNKLEVHQKIDCLTSKLNDSELRLAQDYLDKLSNRSDIPFGQDFLPNKHYQKIGVRDFFTFFTTSEHEFSVIKKYYSYPTYFESQIFAIKKLYDAIRNFNPSIYLIIRLHPRIPNKSSRIETYWHQFQNLENLIIIDAKDELDSYKLGSESLASFVWDSLIGFELAARGLPVGVFGTPEYAALFGKNWLKNQTDLEMFIRNPRRVTQKNLLKFAFHLKFAGFEINENNSQKGNIQFLHGLEIEKMKIRALRKTRLGKKLTY